MKNARERCPTCDRESVAEFAPFCSKGCRGRDMLRWLNEGYRVPGPPVTDGLDSEDNPSL
ncbi:MAG: DNA gyrase inhibitor YacG [Pseudomonadota bacterium]